jgi:hypothetical protein
VPLPLAAVDATSALPPACGADHMAGPQASGSGDGLPSVGLPAGVSCGDVAEGVEPPPEDPQAERRGGDEVGEKEVKLKRCTATRPANSAKWM